MKTGEDVTAQGGTHDASPRANAHRAGHAASAELLSAQSRVPRRSWLARLAGISPLNAETHVMYRGVVGELAVIEALSRLGPGYIVLHAPQVDSDAAEFDHLVIGPTGIFVVATKNHAGLPVWVSQRTFMVAGVRFPHVRTLEVEMGRAERLLSTAARRPIKVDGVLAIVAPKSLLVHDKPRDVAVLQSHELRAWIADLPRVLTDGEVAELGAAAATPSTGVYARTPLTEPASIREEFGALRTRVRRAWRRQLVWAIAVTAMGVGTFVALTYSIFLTAVAGFGR